MTALTLQAFAEIFSERLLNTAVEGVVLAGLAWVFLRIVGRQNSGARFAIWFSTLVLIAALPFLPFITPSSFQSVAVAHLHRGVILSPSWAPYFLALWGAGAAVLIFRLCIGLWRVRNLRRSCTEVDLFNTELVSLDLRIAAGFRDSALRRRVKLCVSSEIAVPAAIGFFRPAIVFPAWLLPQLSVAEMEMILLHELAHLHRWDDWTNLAQKILKAFFFFHPAVWWIENRLTLEREMACDDMVLAQTGSPKTYASSLISFAEKLQNARALALAQALVSRMHQMSLRIAQILDAKRSQQTVVWKPVVGASVGLLALVFGAAPYMPRIVAFQSASPRVQIRTTGVVGSPQPHAAAFVPVANRQNGQQSPVPQTREIQAAFHPRAPITPRRIKAVPLHNPVVVQTKAVQQEVPVQETILILRTTGYDAFGAPASRVWTLCIWTIDGNTMAKSTMVSGSI